MSRISDVRQVPVTDRPVADRNLSGVKDFLGLYGGEHIAATEFVFGATMVTWGCSAKMILIGLIIGNLLATLSFTFFCALMGTRTRLTLYSYLKKVLGKYAQKVYTLVWGICSITLAASGLCVSATSLKEVAGIAVQQKWYPTSAGFVAIVIVLGLVVTLIAANGFEACAKFSGTCVPWMILIFFIGAMVSLPQLADATGVSISSWSDVWQIFDNNVGIKSGLSTGDFGVWHVIFFAWLNNLAWHIGLNDMGLFRFAKNYKYGYVSAIGMFIGHFFAWTMAAIMGTTAAAVLNVSMAQLDPGLTTNTVFGLTGLAAVVVAGWTTANPTVYRCALSINSFLPKLSHKKATYLVGIFMTILACFPVMQNIPMIALILAWITVGIGAICMVEEFVFPKIGYTKYFSMYREMKVNWAAVITWMVSILFAVICLCVGVDRYFISLPEGILSAVLYLILARFMGARGDYSKEVAEEEQFQTELRNYVEELAVKSLGEKQETKSAESWKTKLLSSVAYADLVVLFVTAVLQFQGNMTLDLFKNVAFILTLIYFILNGAATYIRFKNEKHFVQ